MRLCHIHGVAPRKQLRFKLTEGQCASLRTYMLRCFICASNMPIEFFGLMQYVSIKATIKNEGIRFSIWGRYTGPRKG